MRAYRWFFGIAGFSLLMDQLAKWLVSSSMQLHQSIELVENFFHLTYVRNPGAAFGLLARHSLRMPFFIGISLVATLGILWYARRTKGQRLIHLALGLILSGALGNLIDRIRFGEVIDFLDLHWYQYHWPAFNIADSAICVGVALLLFDSWREERQKKLSGTAA